MFDHVVVLDETLHCPHGHRVHDFQTKSFPDSAMDTYLVDGSHVYLVLRGEVDVDESAERWLREGEEAVYQRRHALESIVPPGELVFYTSCGECPPVLVRSDRAHAWGDLVDERQLWVELRATFGVDGVRHIERTSGTRDDLATELRHDGLRVVRDDDPLAVAHLEIRAVRRAKSSRR
jgi:hypothetical protein